MSTGTRPVETRGVGSGRARRELVWAWVSVVVMGGLLVGTVMGTISEILGPITVVVALIAVGLGLSARRHGEPGGLLPAVIGGLVGGFFLVMFLLAMVLHFGFGWE